GPSLSASSRSRRRHSGTAYPAAPPLRPFQHNDYCSRDSPTPRLQRASPNPVPRPRWHTPRHSPPLTYEGGPFSTSTSPQTYWPVFFPRQADVYCGMLMAPFSSRRCRIASTLLLSTSATPVSTKAGNGENESSA